MITAIIFILILSVLVLVHEFGHFIVAKLSGMRVDEFAIGFPPRLWSWKKGETTYAINLLLFGGYVKIHGENQSAPVEGADNQRSFGARPRYLQALVLVAGVTCNILFAWLLISVGFMYGLPASSDFDSAHRLTDQKIILAEILPASPAEQAGLEVGDEIRALHIKDMVIYPTTLPEVQQFIAQSKFQSITIDFVRFNTASSTTVMPETGIVSDAPGIGIGLDSVGILKLPIHLALWDGARLTWYSTKNITQGLGQFVYKAFTEKGTFSQVSGPVGIAHLVGDARTLGISYLITLISFISINLAVINLVPFPALDGGRLLFVLIESVTRRPISARISNVLNTTGFLLLLLLMAVVTYNDVVKLVFK